MKTQKTYVPFGKITKRSIVFFTLLILVSVMPIQLFAGQNYYADRIYLGKKWSLSGVGDAISNDDWLRLLNYKGTGHYGGFAADKLWCTTGIVQKSDITSKKDIIPLKNSLEKVKLLRGVSFRWRDSENAQDLHIGLIAQEVEQVFPEVVSVGPDGKKGINYAALVAPLINAIQEQDKIIEEQYNTLSVLEHRIAALEQVIEANSASVSSTSSTLPSIWLLSGVFLVGGFGLVFTQRWRSRER
jgi:hypothetical protein